MKRTLALILALLMLLSVMAGCGKPAVDDQPGNSQAPAPGTSEAPVVDDTPARTDMNTRIWAEIVSLDPTMNSNATDLGILFNIYDSLFEAVNGDYNQMKGSLVEDDYIVNETATYYEFKVKEGIKWHNGDILTAEDCVFSVNRMRTSPVTAARIASIVDVTLIDEMTFSITCAYSMPRLPALLSTASMSIVNKKLVEQYGDNAVETCVGTGAYKLESWETDKLVLTAFEDCWRGSPVIKTLNYVLISDTTAGSIAFANGDIDQWYVAEYAELEEFDDYSTYRISPYTTNTTDSLVFNTSRTDSWVSNKDFRLACAYAIDRALVTEIATDNLYKTIDSIFTKGNGAYDPDWVYPFEYNPDQAKQLLDKCGYDGAPVTFVYCSAYPIPTAWATTIEACLRAVGINVNMEGTDLAGAIDRFVRRDFDMACLEYGASYPDPLSSIYALFRSDGYYNAWCYSTPEIDAKVLSMYGIADPAAQAEAMQELDQWAMMEGFYIPFYQVGGYAIYPATLRSNTVPEPMFGWARICYSYWLSPAELAEEMAAEKAAAEEAAKAEEAE